MYKFYNLFRYDKTNLGDLLSCPGWYYPDLNFEKIDILSKTEEYYYLENDTLIVGGGGLINPTFINTLKFLSTRNKLIGWGLGENWFTNLKNKLYYGHKYFHPILNNFDLIGLRDFNSNFRYVPCVSCKHDIFNNSKSTNKSKVGLYYHFRVDLPFKIDKISNFMGTIEEKINFIKNHEIIITNSYHGAYWSMLLNKKLIVVPFGSKFYGLNEKVLYIDFKKIKYDLDYDYPDYNGFLEKCRELNDNFAEDVRVNILSI